MLTTSSIIDMQRRTGKHPRYLSPEGYLSSTSTWDSSFWKLDPPSSRRRASDFNVDWSTIPSSQVPEFKELLWSLLISRPEGPPVPLAHAQSTFYRLRRMARWMHRKGLRSTGQLTPAAVALYLDDLKASLRRQIRDRDEDLSTAAVAGSLRPLQYAFEQRSHLRATGFKPMTLPPFGEASPWAEAASIVEHVSGFTPPLPDEVVMPIINRALFLIGEPAEEMIALQMQIVDIFATKEFTTTIKRRRRLKLLKNYVFKSIDGEPWRAPLGQWSVVPGRPEPADQAQALRRLIFDIVAACVLVIRFYTGIRHGEILTWPAGLDEEGLPRCVDSEDSVSGVYELFFAKGVLEKGVDQPTDARWLLAGRLKGGTNVPDALRALDVLNRILEPWRRRSSHKDARTELLIQFMMRGFPTKASQFAPMTSSYLGQLMKRFYAQQVDLTALSNVPGCEKYAEDLGYSIQSRQWRKTWANFVFRTDGRLLPSISQQFQHSSTLLTQEAYVGKDPAQLGLVESAAMERASAFVRRVLDGESGVGGGMRKVVEDLDDLKRKAAGLTSAEKQSVAETWLAERAVKMWRAPHGNCFIGLLPEESRCHEASGTADWSNLAPNFVTRSARLCSGCRCFAIDEQDIPYWVKRYVDNKRIWDDACRRYLEVHYVVAKERFEQSARLLKSLGIDAAQLEEKIDAPGDYA
jgi:hypothetical protein